SGIDALVLLSAPLVAAVGKEALVAFCNERVHVPRISIGVRLPGVATVRADGRGGVKKAVMHLVEAHGRKRIGFVRESETNLAVSERLAGYEEGLADAGIPRDPSWTVSIPTPDRAGDAIGILFDERKQDLDALLTFSDA